MKTPDSIPDEVTQAMDRVMEQLGEYRTDPMLDAAVRGLFERTEW